eukprot:scaffold9532_cov143-Isochrysis_galbana.AAC.1
MAENAEARGLLIGIARLRNSVRTHSRFVCWPHSICCQTGTGCFCSAHPIDESTACARTLLHHWINTSGQHHFPRVPTGRLHHHLPIDRQLHPHLLRLTDHQPHLAVDHGDSLTRMPAKPSRLCPAEDCKGAALCLCFTPFHPPYCQD